MKKIYYIIGSTLSFFGLVGFANAYEYTADDIQASVSTTLTTNVNSIISTALNFFVSNLPLIITLGVAVGMLFWLIRKAVKGIKGKS